MSTPKCTCPECELTFPVPANHNGTIVCPICDTQFPAPASLAALVPAMPRSVAVPMPVTPPPPTRPPISHASEFTATRPSAGPATLSAPDTADAESARRSFLVNAVTIGILLFLTTGVGLGIYVVHSMMKSRPGDEPSHAGNNRPEPPVQPVSPVLTPLPIPPAPDPTPDPQPSLSPEQLRINQSIERGVGYLKKTFGERAIRLNSYEGGLEALLGLTMLECGVPAKDPVVQQSAQSVRGLIPRMRQTYSLALAILFLDRLGEADDRELIQTLALRLIAGQTSGGCWSYTCPALTPDEEKPYLEFLNSIKYTEHGDEGFRNKLDQVKHLPNKLKGSAVVQRAQGKELPFGSGDHSNAQFAVLALWVAKRQGLPVQPALSLADRHFRNVQHGEGSFGYIGRDKNRRGSMTCAGLLGLAVGRTISVKSGSGDDKDPAIEKGLRYLADHFDQSGRSEGGRLIRADSWGDLYYLWSLERVAVVYDLKTLNNKDWYAWASEIIVKHQQDDGSWRDAFAPPIDTCFALLVLKRVNVAQDLTSGVKKVLNIKDLEGPGKK